MTLQSFESAYGRIKTIANVRTQVELAQVLGIRQSSISDAKRRNAIPSDWLVKLLDGYGVNPTWIRTGEGSMYLKPADQGTVPTPRRTQADIMNDAFRRVSDGTHALIMVPADLVQQHMDEAVILAGVAGAIGGACEVPAQ